MSKVATYLNEHLVGEVITQDSELRRVETDGSILVARPEMVVRVANMSDIRKIMRFCSQLAEKGHVLPVSVQGYLTDGTGAAVGRGISIDMASHMHHVVGIDPKQRLIHLQSGVSVNAANATLSTHKGLGLPSVSYTDEDGTIGGAFSTAPSGITAGTHGFFGNSVQQAEVVLSNGDVIQTGRISKRELSKKKGLATFEGEIYREIDNLINDNIDLIAQIDPDIPDTTGYSGIARVKQKDTFDLTPLFLGAQGSLGIVCEVIMQASFIRPEHTVVIAAYKQSADAQAAIDTAMKSNASAVELFDGRLFRRAEKAGKKFEWAPKECYKGAVVMAIFDDFSDRTRSKLAKKLQRKLESSGAESVIQIASELHELPSLHAALQLTAVPAEPHAVVPRAFTGIWLATAQLAGFLSDMRLLETKYGVEMPFFVDYSSGYVALYPTFDSKKVSDRQKILQLLAEVTKAVDNHDGSFAGFGGDGRLKSNFIYKFTPDDEKALYQRVKQIFDPMGVLSPNIKTEASPKDLASEINAWCKQHNQA